MVNCFGLYTSLFKKVDQSADIRWHFLPMDTKNKSSIQTKILITSVCSGWTNDYENPVLVLYILILLTTTFDN